MRALLRSVLLLLSFTNAAVAQRAGSDLPARIDAWATNLVAAHEISGILLVARGDSILYHRAFGPGITTETQFPVASLTKPLTSIVALNLVSAGKLALTDTIGTWLTGFPRAGQITVDILMRHRSGIPHRVTRPDDENTRRTAADMVRLAALATPLFPPDSSRLYSSAGYSVLARVLELAGGTTYARLVDSIVFRPVHANHSVDATKSGVPRGSPASLVETPHGLGPAPEKDYSFLVGAGSVYSTPEDYFRIMRHLLAGGYGAASRQRQADQAGNLAWNGITNGFRAFADYDAGSDITVIFMGNRFTGATDLIRSDVPRLARGETVAAPTVPRVTARPHSPELQRRYAGNYLIGSPTPLSYESATFGMVGSYSVIPTSDTTFYSPQDYQTVRVVRDSIGAVQELVWGENHFPRVR